MVMKGRWDGWWWWWWEMMMMGVGGWIEICMCVYDIDQIVLPIFYL